MRKYTRDIWSGGWRAEFGIGFKQRSQRQVRAQDEEGRGLLTNIPMRDRRIEMKLQESWQMPIKMFTFSICVYMCVHVYVWGAHVGVQG